MRVAALYDVHANVRALEAVLAELGDVDAVVFGGDLVAGPWPRETLELARSLDGRARFVQGNWERYIHSGVDRRIPNWLREQLEGCDIVWPETLVLDGALYCHATPRSDEELVLPEWGRSDWTAFTDELVVCGHTHVQYVFEHDGSRIVNPGSVGAPTCRAAAWWAIVDDGDVELRTTDYDVAAAVAEIRALGSPYSPLADELLEPYSVAQIVEIIESMA